MECELRISGMVEESIVDGPGVRFAVFTQGCPHACAGCHNPETHDFKGGKVVTADFVFALFKENPLLDGITFSGGEPFVQPEALCRLGQKVRATGKNIVTYTGFVFEDLLVMAERNPHVAELLELTDILIDGPYIAELRDLELQFRGSSNQRVLDRAARKNC